MTKEITIQQAMERLTLAIQEEPDYAQGWHDNIAVAAQDAGTTYKVANDGASRFMKLAFNVDTRARV